MIKFNSFVLILLFTFFHLNWTLRVVTPRGPPTIRPPVLLSVPEGQPFWLNCTFNYTEYLAPWNMTLKKLSYPDIEIITFTSGSETPTIVPYAQSGYEVDASMTTKEHIRIVKFSRYGDFNCEMRDSAERRLAIRIAISPAATTTTPLTVVVRPGEPFWLNCTFNYTTYVAPWKMTLKKLGFVPTEIISFSSSSETPTIAPSNTSGFEVDATKTKKDHICIMKSKEQHNELICEIRDGAQKANSIRISTVGDTPLTTEKPTTKTPVIEAKNSAIKLINVSPQLIIQLILINFIFSLVFK